MHEIQTQSKSFEMGRKTDKGFCALKILTYLLKLNLYTF